MSSGGEGSDDEGDENPFQDDSNAHDDAGGERRPGRRKITIEYIEDKSKRHITFSKRKSGIMKKVWRDNSACTHHCLRFRAQAFELSTLTGTQVLLVVASETGHVYTFATKKLKPLITRPEGKNLIQACLNAPDSPPASPDRGDAVYAQQAAAAAAAGAPPPRAAHPGQLPPPAGMWGDAGDKVTGPGEGR